MRIILDFDEDEAEAARTAIDGGKWRAVVAELSQELRNKSKWGDDLSAEQQSVVEWVRAELRKLIDSEGLSLDP